ncbi:hypothetical protein UZ35_16090 [Heyndrickxia coagulans]|uniref:Uncharacterized protein n=1 Tax=Heyndrickxia coagulans TaxID=1398 RepID=A0AAN0WCP2_HEYCO|nr:hypothetical protein SB48_HM08orf04667 [Heyndrickxia coagulans]KGB30914.1 hypothetical protein IE89_01920 [Heyndrickxia coagulans]KXT19277.1 hypothetical protein UZ35_16090 [Heyndrickxia coagulans]
MFCFVRVATSKRHFDPVATPFVLLTGSKGYLGPNAILFLSFWQVQRDISDPDVTCFVLLAGSKRHFGPGSSVFCPFDGFKRIKSV